MENSLGYSKKLCMSELRVLHTHYTSAHYYDAGAGRVNSSFVYLLRGEVTLSTVGREIRMGAGSLFYIPEGIRYHSVWRGTPDVEFYTFEIISKPSGAGEAQSYAMRYLPELSTERTGELFIEIYRLFATEERRNKIRALGKYYDFYADVLPYLSPEPPRKYNPALLLALEHIEKNAHRDYGTEELAAHCCVSESRLYHIFKSQLGTTPVRFRNELRVENAAMLLRSTNLSIDAIAEKCGFHSAAYLRKTFRDSTGLPPSEYRAMV